MRLVLRISRWGFCCQFHFTSYYDFEYLDWWCAPFLESIITVTKWLFALVCDIWCFPVFRVLLPCPHLWTERGPAWSGPQILGRKAKLNFQTELSSYCSILNSIHYGWGISQCHSNHFKGETTEGGAESIEQALGSSPTSSMGPPADGPPGMTG